MRCVIVTRYGGPETLELQDHPLPDIQPDEVLVRVKAAGINYADIMQRRGLYPDGPTPPFVAGFEICGMVEKAGADAALWNPGDEVMGFCSGGYAEHAAVPVTQLMPKPKSLSCTQAVALPCQGLTAYHALITLGNVHKGQTVLIQAAAGGLGVLMVQIARTMGASVIGTCSSDEKCALLTELGCQHPINYQTHDFEAEVKKITAGRGCDLAVDSVGGEVFDKSLQCLASHGLLITLGMASTQLGSVQSLDLLVHNWKVAGFHLFGYTSNASATATALRDFNQWIDDGKLSITAKHVYPLEQAAEAQEMIAARKTIGKVVLIP
ncbi:MAG TPA: NADPH:quinone oxidoreductase family protein [Candidatus Hydrogenedentes bacterium]|nr:NADPH:quinone oxidoreductase family protein [Candidatus Hydrogenedentota bacterium]